MNPSDSTTSTVSETKTGNSLFALVLRIVWMLGGNFAMMVAALYIVMHDISFSLADIVLVLSPPLMIWARRVDIVRFNGATAYGEPATLADWRKYARNVIVGALLALASAHGLQALLH